MARSRGRILDAIEEANWDVLMVCAALGLTLFGIVMVYSASGVIAAEQVAAAKEALKPIPMGGEYYIVIKQVIWAALGIVAMLVLMRIDYQHYARPTMIVLMLGLSVVGLVAVFFFERRNGAHRWINFAGFSAQPSEFAKIVFVIFMAYFLARRNDEELEGSFQSTFIPAGVMAAILMALILKEPDLGTALMIAIVFVVMMLVGRVPLFHLASMIPVGLLGFYFLVLRTDWRWKRFMAFMDPTATEELRRGAGYQVLQSLYAVGSGGVSGVGLGAGKQKLRYLPEPHSDYIFAVVGEELGFIGAAAVLLVFGILLWRCLQASFRAPDRFGQLLGMGLTVMLIAQAFFNVSVVLSLVPTKGIPLPFVSAGGSSLLIALAAVGILLNISEQARAE